MLKSASYITRFLALSALCILVTSMVFFALSSYLFTDTFNSANRAELDNVLSVGEKLLDEYADGEINLTLLRERVNPVLSTGSEFLMLLDADGNVLAYTDSAVPYFVTEAADKIFTKLKESGSQPVLTRYTEQGTTAFIAGKKVDNGFVLAGKTMSVSTGAVAAFRNRLLLCMAIVMLMALLLSLMATRFVARPARTLADAAARLIDGEQVLLPEDMPGEMHDIALAFNHMSRTIATAFQDLRFEKETMRLILESLSEGIFAIDPDGKTLHENSAAVALLGGADTDARREVRRALDEVIAENRFRLANTNLPAPQNAQEEQDKLPMRVGKIQREGKILLYIVTPLPDSPGRHKGAVALVRDITEQERLERTRHDYVANISHELRTPLASMRGLAEGLRDGLVSDPDEQMKCYTIIVDEVTRLSRLVNDLLELSGLQSNPAAFEMEKVDPGELVLDLHDRNASLFREAEISFVYSLPDEDDENMRLPRIESNEDRLAQVLTIFLDNARKYTPAGGSVTLGAERSAPEGKPCVRFFVRDTGIGMDEETRRLAFDRFHQAEKSHSGKGSGLGLAIAREVMQKMNISIELKSEIGKGSEFSFVIPALKS